MEIIDLFSSKIYRFKIDPNSYDKDKIVSLMKKNYEINPQRNSWDQRSIIHHLYNDWNNKNFHQVDTTSLVKVYEKIIEGFIDTIKFSRPTNYSWNFENLSINTKYMEEHDHIGKTKNGQTFFVGIHYIKFDKEIHSHTGFRNPLEFLQFEENVKQIKEVLLDDSWNSSYFQYWDLDCEEDDFIMFPCYLKHIVPQKDATIDTNRPRITAALNLVVEC